MCQKFSGAGAGTSSSIPFESIKAGNHHPGTTWPTDTCLENDFSLIRNPRKTDRVIKDLETETKKTTDSYRQILKSTTIIGGSSFVNIILRIIRIKFLAVFLGPTGVGLFGMYSSITGMVGALAGMGIDTSGVRQIAEAASTGDKEKIARTRVTLLRSSFLLGLFGMVLLIVLSSPISRLTFESTDYTTAVILISVIILLETVMNGNVALIQGMRHIADLAKLNVLSALFGTLLTIPIIYIWGQKGIVPFLIVAAALSTLTAWWYARKIKVSRIQVSWADIRAELAPLLKLGSAIMASVLVAKAAMYLLRVLVAKGIGIEAVGLYQASMTLSSIYVGFILSSMVKDYLPRLTATANDSVACNKLVNEQVEIGILMAAPGILATLTFAPMIIRLFYTAEFIDAFEILRWQVLGILLQVASWPIGFILQAQGRGKLFFITSFLAHAVHVILLWVGIPYFGLNGTGMAFFGMWTFYLLTIYVVANRLTGFSWSGANIRLAILILPAVAIVFMSSLFLNNLWSMTLGIAISAGMSLYSIKYLINIISPDGLAPILAKIKHRFRRNKP